MPVRLIANILILTVQLVLAACGNIDTGSAQLPAQAPAVVPAETVNVKITEWKIDSSRVFFVVGKSYRIVVTNAAQVPIEWEIARKGPTSTARPSAGMVQDNLPPGGQATHDYVFHEAADLQIASQRIGSPEGASLAISARNRSLQVGDSLPW